MSGGVPKRILITQTQRNTPSKAGNAVPKKAIIACSGEKSRTALCNYVRKRTNVFPLPTSYSWSTQMTAADLNVGSLNEIAGFSSITAGGVTAAGSLNPSGPSWTEILSIYTFDPQQLIYGSGIALSPNRVVDFFLHLELPIPSFSTNFLSNKCLNI